MHRIFSFSSSNMQSILVVLLFIFKLSSSTFLHVKPNNDSLCPSSLCLTLDQYAKGSDRYFTGGATLLFLSGNHFLDNDFTLRNISSISLKKAENDSNVTINIIPPGTFQFQSVSRIEIEGIVFKLNSSAFSFASCQHVIVSNSMFKGTRDLNDLVPFSQYIMSNNSNITILSCQFIENAGTSIIFALGETLTLIRNTFIRNNVSFSLIFVTARITTTFIKNRFISNEAQQVGGAVFFSKAASITLIENTFIANRADIGAALAISGESTVAIIITRNNFTRNSGAGTIYLAQLQCTVYLLQNYFSQNQGSTIWAIHSTNLIVASHNVFTKNVAPPNGVIYAVNVINLIVTGNNVFTENRGVIFTDQVSSVSITSNNTFIANQAAVNGGAICTNQVGSLLITENVFIQNQAQFSGGAIYAANIMDSKSPVHLNITGNIFIKNNATEGGAISVSDGLKVLIAENIFSGNQAILFGGALSILFIDKIAITGNVFALNQAKGWGGAVYTFSTSTVLIGTTSYSSAVTAKESIAWNDSSIICGEPGCINKETTCFCDNEASYGGATVIALSNAVFNETNIIYRKNRATSNFSIPTELKSQLLELRQHGNGGAIFLVSSFLLCTSEHLVFVGNRALRAAGGALSSTSSHIVIGQHGAKVTTLDITGNSYPALHLMNSTVNSSNINVTISENNIASYFAPFLKAYCNCYDGALHIEFRSELTLNGNVTFINNRNGAISIYNASVTINGDVTMLDNSAETGGGINCESAIITFNGNTKFIGNKADNGGAIYSRYGYIYFSGSTMFTDNKAHDKGGALYTLSTKISLEGTVLLSQNLALNGGALFLEGEASLTLEPNTTLTTTHNSASDSGGAIYHVDTVTSSQCHTISSNTTEAPEQIRILPSCFIELRDVDNDSLPVIYAHHNTAANRGSFLFGGLLDRCKLLIDSYSFIVIPAYNYLVGHKVLQISKNQDLTSGPYQLCLCSSDYSYSCDKIVNVETNRGQPFNISLIALGQGNSITSTQVLTSVSENATLPLEQSTIFLPRTCTNLTYSIYSKEDYEELFLYPDGLCRDIGSATVKVTVTLFICPPGFILSGAQCVCTDRLHALGANCTITRDGVFILRNAGSNFWLNASYSNHSYQGLILYPSCPVDYCKEGDVLIKIDHPDTQCAHRRSGMLCGACATNYSLLLGTSRCAECSNQYISLLLLFALAGIVLVALLTTLRLTVATGMINSLILYANIVQVNNFIFFSSGNAMSVIRVFIAWLNLDLGIEICFFVHMDAYIQTWLQFAFPLYVWTIIALIIISSRYSITVSKLIGRNPIAVLATLMLMSYTKILRIIIEVFSSVSLEYPNKRYVRVWLKDANVPYLSSKHLMLAVTTSLIFSFFFLPYTFFLLFGYKLYRFSGRKYMRWIHKVRPLLESYYAPYKTHTRYWTGLLLLVRCVLYAVFSYFSLGNTKMSLLAIIITFTAIGFISSGRIYKSVHNNITEFAIYLNLIILSAASLTDANKTVLANILIGIVVITMLSIIVYHFYLQYLQNAAILSKIRSIILQFCHKSHSHSVENERPMNIKTDDKKIKKITRTFVDLREPILEL